MDKRPEPGADGWKFIAEALTDYYGEACEDYDPYCKCCAVWKFYREKMNDA